MSGHSKWSSIKHKKGAIDAKRGKIFTKLIKEISIAARLGGRDPENNSRLRSAIATAKAENMPKDNIERAIKKGTGELEGINYEELTYEGYGPKGVAILVNAMTDNKNRATSELRHIFSKNHGALGEAGCVSWMFEKKGMIVCSKKDVEEDRLTEIALDAGADDIKEVVEDEVFEIYTDPSAFDNIKKVFDENNIKYKLAEISMIPQTYIKLDGKDAENMLKLMEVLEDCDEVQNVYANFDVPDKIIEEFNR